jgi:hypothetical protein
MKIVRIALGAAVVAAMGLSLAAADPAPQKGPRKDPQASYEPRSGPGEGQKYLQRFVGKWTVVKTFYPRNGDPSVAKGDCVQTMINDGRFLKSEFTLHAEAGDTTGFGLIGFEPETGKFTSVWADSRQTRMSFRQGNEPFDGKEIHLVAATVDPSAKPPRPSHTVSRISDDGNTITHKQFASGADGKDRLMMELVLMRKAE